MRARLRDGEAVQLIADARAGNSWATGRLLSLSEDPVAAASVARAFGPPEDGRHAHIIGVTGAPGAGKSTTVSALVGKLRAADRRVAVLAIDPSSPYSGGALLGDRARMREHTQDPGVFIRSMSSRGQLGGLSRATPQALQVLAAVGFDVIVIETVGVGQSEVDVVRAADTVVVVSAPGMGDDLQALKAGVLEIADIYVVNKADMPGADQLVRQLKRTAALSQAGIEGPHWRRPVVRTVASNGDVDALEAAVSSHQAFLGRSDVLPQHRRVRIETAIRGCALQLVNDWLSGPVGRSVICDMTARVLAGERDEWGAAHTVVALLVGPSA